MIKTIPGMTVRIKQETVVTIGDLIRFFPDEEKAQSWISEIIREVEVYENLGILSLVSSDDSRFGQNGSNQLGWAQVKQSGHSFTSLLERARNYASFVLIYQDTSAYDDMPYNEWIPIRCKQELLSAGITGERR